MAYKEITKEELKEVLRLHELWLYGVEGGIRANLEGVNLTRINFDGVNFAMANLDGTNLDGTSFDGSNLDGTSLKGVSLWGCRGNNKQIKSIHTTKYDIAYTKDITQIGCKSCPIKEWEELSDEVIDDMDGSALEWWKQHKELILAIIDTCPAEE